MESSIGSKRNILFIYLASFFGNGYFERAIFILYLIEKGYSLLEVGFLQSLVNLTMFVCEIPTGIFADRIGRKNSLLVGRFFIVLYFVGLIFASHYVFAAASFVMLGLGVTFISGSEEALLFDSSKAQGKEKEFTRISGRYAALITLILAVAMGAGGYLKAYSWTLVFLVSIAFQVVAMVITLLIKEIRAEGQSQDRPPFTQFIKDTASFLRMNGAVRSLIIGIAIFDGMISIYLIFVQELLKEIGYAAYFISTISAISSLLSAVASDRVHLLEKRFSAKSVSLVTVCITCLLFLMSYPQIAVLSVIAFVFIRLCLYLFSPISYTLINVEIPSSQRATILSVMNFISSLVMFVLSPITGYMADKFGAGKFMGVTGTVSMVLAFICFAYFFKVKQRKMGTEINNPL